MNKKSVKRAAFHILNILVSAILIVYFLPHEHTFSYDFTVGKPWKYGQIIADYDFPIYKSEQTISQERDSVMRQFQPYLKSDAAIGELQIRNLRKDYLTGHIAKVPPAYIQYLSDKLREVYEAGILDSHEYDLMLDSNVIAVRIVTGTTALSRPLRSVYTTRTAYMHIFMADSVHFRHDILSQCNVNNYLTTNMTYDRDKSRDIRADLLSSISYASGMVQSGQKIVDRGEIVTPHTLSILESMKKESIKRNDNTSEEHLLMAGQFIFIVLLLCIFIIYLKLFRMDYMVSPRSIFLLYSLIVIFPIFTAIINKDSPQSVYIIPFAIVAIFVRVFMDSRTAFMVQFITVFLSSLALRAPYEFVIIQTLAGTVAIYSLKELTSRSQLLRTAVITSVVTLLFMFGYDLSQGMKPATLDPSWYASIVINGVLLLFAYPLMFLFEKLFGFTSSVTLVELSNVNTPLLREMSKVAQGTFNHSMQVANLATEVASKIGAKVQLVRTGALYHDIGKMKNPAFFTENQSSINPHDSLSEERSAQIIIHHVADGLEMAEKHHLPKAIRDFIATHHGRSKTKYFYISYVNKHPGEPVNEELFTYPGPNPTTLEQAILMMADSVEAASRSLKVINDDTLSHLVGDIIDSQVNEGYFRDCPITFHDIAVAKEEFITSLKTIYHTRISYPTLNKPEPPSPDSGHEHGGNFLGNYRNWNHMHRDRFGQRS